MPGTGVPARAVPKLAGEPWVTDSLTGWAENSDTEGSVA